MSVKFTLATRDDDAGIRRLLATNPMPGRIRVRFEREPDYFAGCGERTDVLVARDGERVVGVACRSILRVYVNGVPEDVGYLGQLRVDLAYRGQLLTARGYRVMRGLHEREKVSGYFTTIVEGNGQAEGVLVRRSRGLMPRYRFLERLVTCAMSCRPSHSRTATTAATVTTPNLYPAYEPRGEIVRVGGASAALVDQRSFKQTVIDGYDRTLALARPFYNLGARIKLPRANSVLNHAYVTHLQTSDADSAHALLEALKERAKEKGLDHLLLGFTESDPLLAVVRAHKPIEYLSSIYTVAFDDHDDFHERLLARPRALDISAL